MRKGSGDDRVVFHCYTHTVLIHTNNIIYIFGIDGGKWGRGQRACSLSVTTSNAQLVSSETAEGGVLMTRRGIREL